VEVLKQLQQDAAALAKIHVEMRAVRPIDPTRLAGIGPPDSQSANPIPVCSHGNR
jgi:hypothetical protein